jgi:secondary thiamine-phosphate synthase enzyme
MIFTGSICLDTDPTATKYHVDIIDITAPVEEQVARVNIKNGSVTIFVTGSTAAVTTIEYESGLVADLQSMWERLVPQTMNYAHNERWHDGNGYAHVRAALLGASLVVPLIDGKMALGTWQQIVLLDFDNRPRSRQVIVQVMGED